MRSKKALINILFSIMLEVFTIISGFIIPKIIIGAYGSNINGLATSITQFLGYLVLLQSGIGGVVKALLYKPLAKKDSNEISSIVNATDNFFKKIGLFTLVYIIILAFIFSFINSSTELSTLEVSILVIIIGFGTIGQYYVGITYQVLLEASQKFYIYAIIQILAVIFNTFSCVILINLNCNIFIVKLVSSIIFFVKPFILKYYVSKKFKIDKSVEANENSIKQRWDGVGHTIAYFVHSKTDVAVLTLFSTFNEVSVYSVYNMITTGLNTIISTISTPIQAAFGDMIAKNEYDILKKNFTKYQNFIYILCEILFSAGLILTVPFVKIYTYNFDINYVRIDFAFIILIAEMIYCLRMPLHSVIISAGHYKQTKKGAFIEAGINVILSIILVIEYKIVGVAVGTLVAMIYRTFDYILYLHKNILYLEPKKFTIKLLLSFIIVAINVFLFNQFDIELINFLQWTLYSIIVVIIVSITTFIYNFIINKKETIELKNYLINFVKALKR